MTFLADPAVTKIKPFESAIFTISAVSSPAGMSILETSISEAVSQA